MQKRHSEDNKKISKLSRSIFNFVLIAFAAAITIGSLSYLIIQSFSLGIGMGLRSLLAALLPVIITASLSSFVKTGNARQGEFPLVSTYIIFTFLTAIAFLMLKFFENPLIPLSEILFSSIIVSVWLVYERVRFKAFLSRIYGIVSGFLVYVIFFELPI
ncbi:MULTISPECIES: hypothetical protein [unclassified Coleofasciculus]|uniref:hypothetical protein n=1 Tax=unclassified Coleofasciculus TaxID=2692782 RepID=UPI001880D857|nr:MULTISPECIES: hypothetical protein [unclassified Coleofasciculus]MBE9126830.1 hypothetical protein [Coleofasciculus sp. LEGE 07081]MBE9148960.1 hypothetical protein [Coleofasciculus sp. LEGE 07092]